MRPRLSAFLTLIFASAPAFGQTLGMFRWQTQPYCNVLTISVSQNGSVYTLDGYDDQCGAATRATLSGTAVPNPDGTVGLGINIVASPSRTVPSLPLVRRQAEPWIQVRRTEPGAAR